MFAVTFITYVHLIVLDDSFCCLCSNIQLTKYREKQSDYACIVNHSNAGTDTGITAWMCILLFWFDTFYQCFHMMFLSCRQRKIMLIMNVQKCEIA